MNSLLYRFIKLATDGVVMRATLVREHFSIFLHRLLALESPVFLQSSQEDDATQANAHTRLLSHALLNFAYESGTNSFHQISRVIPWLAIWFDWSQGHLSCSVLAKRIVSQGLVKHLAEDFVESYLARATRNNHASPLRRPSLPDAGEDDTYMTSLLELLQVDNQLDEISTLDDIAVCEHLFSNTELLWVAMAQCEKPSTSAFITHLKELFPQWCQPNHSAPMHVLVELERSRSHFAVEALEALQDRSRQFEFSLTNNMARQELLPVVRVTLALAACSYNLPAETIALIKRLALFGGDSSLEVLCTALVEMRTKCIEHLRGALPLESLATWVAFLQDGCTQFSEFRQITEREATNYAHYCLHLVNVCDLASMGSSALNEQSRRALMDIEDELKEFALAGTQLQQSCPVKRLQHFEKIRWTSPGPTAYLADRLARIRGAWRHGIEPAPVGAPPRIAHENYAHSLALLESLIERSGVKDIEALARLMTKSELVDTHGLESLSVEHLLKLLAFGSVAARDLPGVDASELFEIDFTELSRWFTDTSNAELHQAILEQILDQHQITDLLHNYDVASPPAFGLQVTSQNCRAGQPSRPRIVVRFIPDPELIALLSLLKHTPAHAAELRASLQGRLREMLVPQTPRASEHICQNEEPQLIEHEA